MYRLNNTFKHGIYTQYNKILHFRSKSAHRNYHKLPITTNVADTLLCSDSLNY